MGSLLVTDINRVIKARILYNCFWIDQYERTHKCVSKIFGNFKIYTR